MKFEYKVIFYVDLRRELCVWNIWAFGDVRNVWAPFETMTSAARKVGVKAFRFGLLDAERD